MKDLTINGGSKNFRINLITTRKNYCWFKISLADVTMDLIRNNNLMDTHSPERVLAQTKTFILYQATVTSVL